jgi:hypothetical protein
VARRRIGPLLKHEAVTVMLQGALRFDTGRCLFVSSVVSCCLVVCCLGVAVCRCCCLGRRVVPGSVLLFGSVVLGRLSSGGVVLVVWFWSFGGLAVCLVGRVSELPRALPPARDDAAAGATATTAKRHARWGPLLRTPTTTTARSTSSSCEAL